MEEIVNEFFPITGGLSEEGETLMVVSKFEIVEEKLWWMEKNGDE